MKVKTVGRNLRCAHTGTKAAPYGGKEGTKGTYEYFVFYYTEE